MKHYKSINEIAPVPFILSLKIKGLGARVLFQLFGSCPLQLLCSFKPQRVCPGRLQGNWNPFILLTFAFIIQGARAASGQAQFDLTTEPRPSEDTA